jgi:hypothetical protein
MLTTKPTEAAYPVETVDSSGKILHRTIAVTITILVQHIIIVQKVCINKETNNNKLNDKQAVGLSEATMLLLIIQTYTEGEV